jgi:hypothetical protein
MSGNAFALDIARWCEKAKGNADQVVRGVSLELLNRVVLRSPVGNPELWASNRHTVEARKSFNAEAERNNAFIASNPLAAFKYGKLRKQKPLSARAIARRLPLESGKGYVGGRFRGNWQVSIGSPKTSEVKRIDPGGAATIAEGALVIEAAVAGPSIWLMNNVPYAERLEHGWSKQAPAGVVKITVAEFQSIVNEQVRALPE